MRYIFIINGFPRSGKDTFVDILSEISNLPIFQASWVEKIKLMAQSQGWDGKKNYKGRKLLSDLADSNDDKCFKFVTDKEKMISAVKNDFIYCIHARRPKNIQELVQYYTKACTDMYKVITVCIERKSVQNRKQSNTADLEIHDFIYDYYIHNDYENDNWKNEFKENIKIFYNDLI